MSWIGKGSLNWSYRVTRISSGGQSIGSFTTNIPVTSSALKPGQNLGNGPSSAAAVVNAIGRMYIEGP